MATDVNDPIAWALDASGDREILATTGCRFTTGLEAVRQNIETALQLVKDEWFLDEDRGVPLFDEVLGVKFDKGEVIAIYREQIETVPDVIEITKLTATFEGSTRVSDTDFEVLTPFGTVSGSA